jgi:hypothetical protein
VAQQYLSMHFCKASSDNVFLSVILIIGSFNLSLSRDGIIVSNYGSLAVEYFFFTYTNPFYISFIASVANNKGSLTLLNGPYSTMASLYLMYWTTKLLAIVRSYS